MTDQYKARIVTKGFTQNYGVDYKETFAPVAKLNTVRVLFPLQPIFMKTPPGFEERYGTGNVRRLKKTIYGI